MSATQGGLRDMMLLLHFENCIHLSLVASKLSLRRKPGKNQTLAFNYSKNIQSSCFIVYTKKMPVGNTAYRSWIASARK